MHFGPRLLHRQDQPARFCLNRGHAHLSWTAGLIETSLARDLQSGLIVSNEFLEQAAGQGFADFLYLTIHQTPSAQVLPSYSWRRNARQKVP